ncbi:MAG: Smr/MutS family protein [Spirochaetaceae bacterium]|nr:Smr/MutS family protein [Spirochaetaceae bacterium]
MDTNTLELLDYFRIRDTVAGYCMSEEGSAALKERLPSVDAEIIEKNKTEGREWLSYISSSEAQALSGWPAVKPLFKKLGVEGLVLELEEVYALWRFCKCSAQTKQALTPVEGVKRKVETPALSAIAAEIPALFAPENDISRIIDESGQMRDLPELRAIRSSIQKLHGEINALIRSFTSSSDYKDVLQSDVPVLRSDRQVLAVKASQKNRIKGIIHEVSQTGQTVFIEPDAVVQKNNALVQEEFRLSQEVRRILKSLTFELGQYRADFEKAHELMIRLDCAYGAARWGVETDGIFAASLTQTCAPDAEAAETAPSATSRSKSTFSSPVLVKARHPLLGTRAVPITVEFSRDANGGRGHRVLIITGPNTGGKTVTLKTVALFCLLNQSGFPVPAAEGTALPVFTDVFADIGDEQSLDESLSTFSGHMKNIARILDNADENTLVLLDELGSGTDPQEGGAIAMAVLDELIKRDSFVLVTTHHGILKNYGYTHPSCTNASVEFDTTTLAPTYRILMGIPGESHALDIARRNGIPSAIMDAAQAYISNNQADISALIKGLNEKHTELARLEKEFRSKERRISDKWRRVDLKELRLRQDEMNLREQGYRRSVEFLDENRRMLENLVRELREGEITREKTLKVKETIANLSEAVDAERAAIRKEQDAIEEFRRKVVQNELEAEEKEVSGEASALNAKEKRIRKQAGLTDDDLSAQKSPTAKKEPDFAPGIDVLLKGGRQTGVIVSKAKKGSWVVQVGSLRLTVAEKDLSVAPKQSKPVVSVEVAPDDRVYGANNALGAAVHKEISADGRVSFGKTSAERPKFELRLLGMRYEEAIKTLEHQLDLCAINNFKEFSVIHGKGTGILQEAVWKYLSGCSAVKEYHFAKPEDGGTGKTYVTLL